MTYRVVIQPVADRDIASAALWIREQSKSPAKAAQWARSIRASIARLKTHPERCPVDPDSAALGEEVRLLLHGRRRGKYRILFAIRGDTVHVLTVRHSARQNMSEELGLDHEDGGADSVS
jgi:plasmid stabilization system protein ParE